MLQGKKMLTQPIEHAKYCNGIYSTHSRLVICISISPDKCWISKNSGKDKENCESSVVKVYIVDFCN